LAGNSEERCEAHFYIGEWHLMRGSENEALPALRSAVGMCPTEFAEYEGAVAELGRIEK
jgi:rhomboid protease GluP